MFKSKLDNQGMPIHCAHSTIDPAKPNIILVLPFGAKLDAAHSFMELMQDQFNVFTWRSRHILDEHDEVDDSAVNMKGHVSDLKALQSHFDLQDPYVVGYCSGAAVALSFAAQNDNYQALYLVCGEYVLSDKAIVPEHYHEVDTILKMAAKSVQLSTLLSTKMRGAQSAKPVAKEASYFNEPYFSGVLLHRYALNYVDFISHDYLACARKIKKQTYVYSSDQDLHVGTAPSELLCEYLPQAELLQADYGDHYAFCRRSSLLRQVKKDLVNETLIQQCDQAV